MRYALSALALAALTHGAALAQTPQPEAQTGLAIRSAPVTQAVIEQRLGAYTVKNDQREPAVRKLFEDAGCGEDRLTEQKVGGTKAPNLICTSPGESQSEIVVGAHFDFIEAGHGVVDNWTGAALLPSLYQGLVVAPRHHTFRFVAFAGEEKGLLGSREYAGQAHKTRERIAAMVNMDTLGLAETEIWVSKADPKLVRLMQAAAVSTHLPLSGMNVDQVGTTDSAAFTGWKIPAITVHSLTSDTLDILHSSKDRIEAVHMDRYYRTYRLVLAYLALLDVSLN